MRIVVTGATGFLGRALTARLVAAQHDVTALTRHPRGLSGVHETRWEPTGDAGPWASAIDGADAIVHLAGEPIGVGRWTRARKAVLLESRVVPTHSLVAAIDHIAARPRLLVSASAVGYYGPRDDELVTEDTPAGRDFLATLCVEWENAALRAEALGTRVVTIRSGLVLGAGGGALQRMLLPFRLGLGGALGDGTQYWPWIHLDDWVGIVEFLLAQSSVSGPVNVTAPTPQTNLAFSRTLARVLKRPCVFRVPGFALRLAMGELVDALVLSSQRALPTRALALGFSFAYDDLETALRQILTSAGRAAPGPPGLR